MTFSKIIWAVEAAPEFDQTEKAIIQNLEVLTRSGGRVFQIEPVHVLPSPYLMARDMVLLPSPIDLQREALDLLTLKLAKVNLPGLLPPHVISEPVYTNAQAAGSLVRYAEKTKAELIVVGTHAKRGLARLFLGSFAESLLLVSAVPVFTVNPGTTAPGKITRILFPTDFEKESKAVFAQVLAFAREFGASISIYHVIVDPLGVRPHPALSDFEIEYLNGRREYAQLRAEEFLKMAHEAGVAGGYTITIAAADVSKKIIKFAKKRQLQVIAMAARSGRIGSLLTGSVTRQVVRASPWPVWVLREKAAAKKFRKAA